MFDPALPANGTRIRSVELRDQFNGLKTLIDAVPTAPITGAVVDSVTTTVPNGDAAASASVTGSTVHFTFTLPRGDAGPPGPEGPAAVNVVVDAVVTGESGTDAQVLSTFDGIVAHFTFTIPRGNPGVDGLPGAPGEVTNASLATALADTPHNCAGVSLLPIPPNDPPTRADLLAVIDKLNELISALQRVP